MCHVSHVNSCLLKCFYQGVNRLLSDNNSDTDLQQWESEGVWSQLLYSTYSFFSTVTQRQPTMDGLNILSENELCHSCQYYYHLCHMYRSLGLVHVLCRSDTEPLTVPALFWTVCFTVIVVVAIIGNCSVLWIVLGKSKFRFPKLEKRWILARSRLKEMLNHNVIPILKCRPRIYIDIGIL